MHPEVEELRPKLKEILYDCAVEIRATKAALYLFDGVSRFELVTEYGFRAGARAYLDENDALVDRCMKGRTPFFVNGLMVDPRFSERLYDAATERMLAAPMYLRGTLVGVIDSRDKAAKQPFDQADVAKIQKIVDRLLGLFTNKNVFGQRFITLSDADEQVSVTTATMTGESARAAEAPRAPTISQNVLIPSSAAVPLPPRPQPLKPQPQPPAPPAPKREEGASMASIIMEARAKCSRLVATDLTESIAEPELVVSREILRKMLAINGILVVSMSAFGHMGGVQEIAAKAPVSGEALNFLQSKLSGWLARRGEPAGSVRTNVQAPAGVPIVPTAIQKVFTAPIVVGKLKGMYLTIGFGEPPDRSAHEMLAANLDELQLVIENSRNRTALQQLRLRTAEKLLEPEFTRLTALKRHTDLVVARVEQFLKALELPRADAETARLTAMVHDVGMRLLDYERLYRKRGLSDDELAFLRDHVFVGAALVEPLLGAEVARAVLAHHERVDGGGYPNALRGDDIPLAARIVQICDAYETMISPDSYQPVDTPQVALATIHRAAGTQFDPDLAKKFIEMLRATASVVTTRA